MEIYSNPTPVVSAIVPVKKGRKTSVLMVRRNIEPQKGKLCFPGGYAETGRTWQQELVREINEESGLELNSDLVQKPQDVQSTSNLRTISIFAQTQTVKYQDVDWSFKNSETQELVWFTPEMMTEVAFPTHKENLEKFFRNRQSLVFRMKAWSVEFLLKLKSVLSFWKK